MAKTRYLLALGSNQRHVRHGAPRDIIDTAIDRLSDTGLEIVRRSGTIRSIPLGPSQRRYANAVAIVETGLLPLTLLSRLQSLEREFGERRGQRWSRRVLDLDIILWEGGMFAAANPAFVIPHRELRNRGFVLGPANQIAADWRDPVSGLTIAHLWWRWKQIRNCGNI